MTEPTLEENVRQILPTLPAPIQKFFEQRKLGETARLLMERYALHIDHGTVIERELMLLLLGLENPDEFADSLYNELPISKQTVRDIITDVNEQIFVPLREELRRQSGSESRPQASGMRKGPQNVVPRPIVATTPQRPVTTQVPPKTINQQPQPRPASQASAMPEKISSSADSKMLADHEEPHIEFKKNPISATESPLRQALRTVVPPENLPGALPPSPIPEVRPSPAIPKVEPQAQPRAAPAPAPKPIIKEYSTDPYREPIEP